MQTNFGWAIAGLAVGVPSPRTSVGFVGHCVTPNTTLNEEVENWWKIESFGTKFNRDDSRSAEDERALKHLEETTNFQADLGHYETGLQWKDEVMLSNNHPPAEKRLVNLERSLDKDSERAKAYYDRQLIPALPRAMPESYLPQRLLLKNPKILGTCHTMQ